MAGTRPRDHRSLPPHRRRELQKAAGRLIQEVKITNAFARELGIDPAQYKGQALDTQLHLLGYYYRPRKKVWDRVPGGQSLAGRVQEVRDVRHLTGLTCNIPISANNSEQFQNCDRRTFCEAKTRRYVFSLCPAHTAKWVTEDTISLPVVLQQALDRWLAAVARLEQWLVSATADRHGNDGPCDAPAGQGECCDAPYFVQVNRDGRAIYLCGSHARHWQERGVFAFPHDIKQQLLGFPRPVQEDLTW